MSTGAYVITFTGITGQLRDHYKAVVTGLRAHYSGSLQLGHTTHLVASFETVEQLRSSAKFTLAQTGGIPVVSTDWLNDSYAHGFLLNHERYVAVHVASPAIQRRLTSESASGMYVRSVEKLRRQSTVVQGEFMAAPYSPPVWSPKPIKLPQDSLQVLHHDAIPDLPASPAYSPSHAGIPSPVQERIGSVRGMLCDKAVPAVGLSEQACCWSTPAAASEDSQGRERLPAAASVQHSLHDDEKAMSEAELMVGSGKPREAMQLPSSQRGTDATPNGAPLATPFAPTHPCDGSGGTAGAGSSSAIRTDSDTRIGRLLTRMGQLLTLNVTVRRCARPPRHGSPMASPSSSPTPNGSGLCAELRDVDMPQDRGHLVHTAATAAAEETTREGAGAAGAAMPPSADKQAFTSLQQHEADGSGMPGLGPSYSQGYQVQRSMASPAGQTTNTGGFVPLTKIVVGPKATGAPSRHTVESLLVHHGLATLGGLTFYTSAQLQLADGRTLLFEAGEATHGAKMVYDLRPDGTRQYALALVLAIYTLPNTSEVWFEHKYFLSRGDLAERPRWSSFLQETVVRQDELLLLMGTYHSPLHLVEEEFAVAFTGHAHLKSDPLPQPRRAYFPCLECRRGFDAVRGKAVPLKKALQELYCLGR